MVKKRVFHVQWATKRRFGGKWYYLSKAHSLPGKDYLPMKKKLATSYVKGFRDAGIPARMVKVKNPNGPPKYGFLVYRQNKGYVREGPRTVIMRKK